MLNYLDDNFLMYYYDYKESFAQYYDKEKTTLISLCRFPGSIRLVGRVNKIYFDSDCEVYSALNIFAPLSRTEPFELINTDDLPL